MMTALSPRYRKWVGRVSALVVLALVFAVGAYLYVHVGGQLFLRIHKAHSLPPVLLLLLALVGGAASFFSPCSLAITPSFLMYFIADALPGEGRGPLMRGSLVVASGIVVFYTLSGALVTALGAAVYNFLIYLIPAAALVFLILGIVILTGRNHWLASLSRFNPFQSYYERMAEQKQIRNPRTLFGFGVAYGAASHTCTLPIFLGIVLMPLASGDYVLAGIAVVIYGLAIAVLLLVMAYLGQTALIGVRRGAGRILQRATGLLFLLTSFYLLYYFGINYGWTF
jgi:cytochrome c biogenesis protein CcdA